LVALCGTVALAGWGVAAVVGSFGSSGTENTDTVPIADPSATSATADAGPVGAQAAAPSDDRAGVAQAVTARSEPPAPTALTALAPTLVATVAPEPPYSTAAPVATSVSQAAAAPEPPTPSVPPAAVSAELTPADPAPPQAPYVLASASAAEVPPPAAPPAPPEPRVKLVSLFTTDPAKEYPKPVVRLVETPNECLVAEICIDDYLWSLYERTPKVDTNKVPERIKVTVKTKKGKTRTVMKTIIKYVIGDFTWKDPIAAQRAGMPLKDYVIGGMDRSFRQKLYRAARAMENAGLMPGITSAFRDDYRQAIASGNKAASDSSYHGGSRRGGYGHGLAADLVSVKGETRMERYASSEELWKWIDAHERELGVGRPYLDRDPPHVGPIDGREYAVKRGGRASAQMAALQTKKAQKAGSQTKKAQKAAPHVKNAQKAGTQAKNAQKAKLETKKGRLARSDTAATKRAKPAKSSKVSGLQARPSVQR